MKTSETSKGRDKDIEERGGERVRLIEREKV